MRTTNALTLLLLTAALSCQKPFYSGTPRWTRMQDRYRYGTVSPEYAPGDDGPGTENAPTVYVSALRFPEGAAWQNGELSEAHIVLWRNGTEILDLPAGHYPEPDRHRVRKGHLWRDDSDGATTYVYRDREEVLRYPGDEILRGFLEVDGDLYTLGQRAGGKGFSFRINGQELLSHPSAKILGSFDEREWEGGAFSLDGDAPCYCYAVPVPKESGTAWEYHVMQGNTPLRTIPAGTAKTVFDVRVWEGNVYRSEQRGQSLFLVKDDKAQLLELSGSKSLHLCRLVPVDGEMQIKGYNLQDGPTPYSYWIRGLDGPAWHMESMLPVGCLYTDNPDCASLFLSDGRIRAVWNGHRYLDIDEGRYVLYTPACSALQDGVLYAALSDVAGKNHLLLQGDQILPFSFNGCFTGIWIE